MDHASMASKPPGSAIAKLGQDIQWYIFSSIADMDSPLGYETFLDNMPEPSALEDLIGASQVCRAWRNLLLRSPSIWAKVLRLDRLVQYADEGRDEILRRTGSALLFVKGRIHGGKSNYVFSADLISQQWERIRRIDIRLGRGALPRHWEAILRPAPHLTSFNVVFEAASNKDSSQTGLFFDGDAPSLTQLCTKNITYNIRAPWTVRLSRLHIETALFSASDILEAIRDMPLLDYLDLHYISGPSPSPLPAAESIHLPRLVDLRLTNKQRLSLPFAHAIKPSKRCTLLWATIGIYPSRCPIDADDLVAIHGTLRRYATGYFTSRRVELLSLKLGEGSFDLGATPSVNMPPPDIFVDSPADESVFCVNLTSGIPDESKRLFLSSISQLDLSSVRKFDFQSTRSFAGGPDNMSELSIFLKALTSVEILSTTDASTSVLLHCPMDRLSLPALRRWELHDSKSEDLVRAFLRLRSSSEVGLPIALVDLSNTQVGDWGFLEEFEGLEVVWGKDGAESRYVCGSGEPDRLDFGYVRAFAEAWEAAFT